MTPNLAIVHVNWLHGPNFRLWLPLFLLWIPALLLAPFVLLVLILGCVFFGVSFWSSIATLWALLCSLRGTDVQLFNEGNRVLVRIL